MEEGAEQDKSEQPTAFKLSKAREKGAIARGTDLAYLTSLAAFLGCLWVVGGSLMGQLQQAGRTAIVAAPNVAAGPSQIMAVTGAVLGSAVRPLAIIGAAIFLVVLVFEIAQLGGFVFTTQPLKMDFSRLNAGKGFKRVFSMRMLIETAKNVLKLCVYGAAAFMVIRSARETDILAITDARHLAEAMGRVGLKLLTVFVAIAVLFAALDQVIARRDFLKKMRMSRRDVRRELRDREGEPRIKQKRKQLHREFVKLSKSLRNIRGADVLITNPTHYAVALRYDTGAMTAPKVVSQGANQFALRLKRLAFLYGVTVVEHRELARALYRGCKLDSEVPEALYKPVADVYRSIRGKAARSSGSAHA